MDIVIAGGHGQVARRLARVLVERGDTVGASSATPITPGSCATTAANRSSATSSAKAEADRALAESDGDWTIVRPGA